LITNLKLASGNVQSKDKLVNFLYLLMREHLTFGQIAKLIEEVENDGDENIEFTNGFAANYAKFISEKLK
jgi:hypothetical protein